MGLLDLIERAINEHGSASVLRERLLLIREQADALEKQVTQLQQENSRIKAQIAKYESQLAAKSAAEEFVEHRGALFKRKPSGGYHLAIYCPSCKFAMGAHRATVPFTCGRCMTVSSIKGYELEAIIKELP